MFSRFLEPYLASAFNAGRTIGISAACLRGAYRATKGGVGDMAMGTGASDNSLRWASGSESCRSHGSRRSRRARVHRADWTWSRWRHGPCWPRSRRRRPTGRAAEHLADDGQSRRRHRLEPEQRGGGGRPATIRRSSWRSGQDNDPVMAAATNNGKVVALEAAYSVNSGQTWLPLSGRADQRRGPAGARRSCSTRRLSGPTVPYNYADRSQAWGSTTATSSTC